MSDFVVSHDQGVLTLQFNSPQTLNAMTPTMVEACTHELEEAVGRDDVRVVVITGSEGAFSAGAALVGENPIEHFDVTAMDRANRLIRAVLRLDKPVLAGVNGIAAGVGCSLAIACDLQIARESAMFLLAFGRIGLTCDGGTSATLAASVGRAKAMRMALLAEPMTAREAAKAGLISHVVPDGEYDDALAKLTYRLAQGAPLAFAATKKLINATSLAQVEQALERERSAQSALFSTHDAAEGMQAFAQKRRPVFEGR